jgi:hypothetical protein
MKDKTPATFAVCLKNTGCEDLVVRKVYRVLPDEKAEKAKHLRIIDESGEDYLYPANYFFVIEVPQKVERSLKRLYPATIT